LLSVIVIVTMGLSAIPGMGIGALSFGNAAAQEGDNFVEVGWSSDMTVWNPLTIQNTPDWTSIMHIYSTLFMYDESLDSIVGSLATDYYQVLHPTGEMSTFINITDSACFRNAEDPEDVSHPLTAFDIEFTLDVIMETTGNMWEYYLYNVTDVSVTDDGAPWDYDRTDSPYQIRIDTEFTKATLLDDLIWLPILPKADWEDKTPQQLLGNMKPADLKGSGPFYFSAMDQGQWYEFKKAPNYHGAADYGEERDIDFDGIRYTVYTDMLALAMAVNKGDVDVADLTGAQTSVWDYVGGNEATVTVDKQVTNELGAIDIAINAIPLEFRTKDYAEGGNKILLDDVVRKAIGMTLNKEELVNEYFEGLPTIADTMINPGYWHATPPDLLPYNPEWARENLTDAGYEDLDEDGYLEVTEDSLSYSEGWADVGDELEFRLHVPDSDPTYETVGSSWVGWAKQAGINFDFEVYSEGYMTSVEWYKLDYDLWVWGWLWTPEPLATLMCWRTDMMFSGGWNCVGPIGDWWWVDEENKIARSEYDDLHDEAMKTVDRDQRKELVSDLQTMLYDSWTEFPPFYPIGLYGITDEQFEGWGNWEDNLGRTVIACLPWLWYDLEVVVNRAPVFDDPPEEDYTAYLGTPKRFNVTVHDYEGDRLYVNFSFGDDTQDFSKELTSDTTIPTNVETTHTYTSSGEYVLTVSITDMYEGRYVYREAPVTVLGPPNDPVELVAFYPSNPSPSYVEEEITWTATVTDPDSGTKGTDLKFTWDWGDGTYTVDTFDSVPDNEPVTSIQSHTWTVPKDYAVAVNIWDYPEGAVSETGDHNVSASMDYSIIVNRPPENPVIQDIEALEGVEMSCAASASDPDMETLRFTWEWDDGTYTVEELTQTYMGQTVTSEALHTWDTAGTYPVTVYVEDLEGGHNSSSETEAVVYDPGTNIAPGSFILMYSPDPICYDVETTFNISAVDANGDAIDFRVDFGDDSTEETASTDGGITTRQYVDFTHTYAEEGTYVITVNATDDDDTLPLSREVTFTVVVQSNRPPTFTIQDEYNAKYGIEKRVQPLGVSDPDGDTVTVWFDWGDDSVSMGDPGDSYAGTHTYTEVGAFILTISVDDGEGNNVSKSATMTVSEANEKAVLESIDTSPYKDEYLEGETITFIVVVSDLEGGNVTVSIDFGDGEDDEKVVNLEATEDTEVTFTHEYDTADTYDVVAEVDDGQPHSDAILDSETIEITIVKESGISIALIAGVIALVLIILAAIWMMRKRKGPAPSGTGLGGMEGMSAEETGEADLTQDSPPKD